MVIYTISFRIKGDPNSNSRTYGRELLPAHEDDPASFFTAKIREEIRRELQERVRPQTITQKQVDWLIDNWIADIEIGARNTYLGEVDLPLVNEENLRYLREEGYQEKPPFVPPLLEEENLLSFLIPSLEILLR